MNEQLSLFLLANRVVFVKAGLLILNSYFFAVFDAVVTTSSSVMWLSPTTPIYDQG
jgi:hypothetical protein